MYVANVYHARCLCNVAYVQILHDVHMINIVTLHCNPQSTTTAGCVVPTQALPPRGDSQDPSKRRGQAALSIMDSVNPELLRVLKDPFWNPV